MSDEKSHFILFNLQRKENTPENNHENVEITGMNQLIKGLKGLNAFKLEEMVPNYIK